MKKTELPAGVRRLPDGKWKVRTYAKCGRTGKVKEIKKTFAAETPEEEVIDWMIRAKQAKRSGATVAQPKKRMTLRDCSASWLDGIAGSLRLSTANHYARVLARHVLPELGNLYVDVLVRNDLQRWVGWAEQRLNRSGRRYAQETLRGWWRVAKQFIRDVCDDHGLADPTRRVRAPRSNVRGRRERRTLTGPQLGDLLTEVRRLSPKRFAEVFVLAHTGLRPGELFALRWCDVDEQDGVLTIRQAHRNGEVGPPKTGDPREVALSDEMLRVLREHRRDLIAVQHPGLEGGLVFPADNGAYRIPQTLHKPLKKAAEAAGIDVRVGSQVLRRTFNTLMMLEGVDRIVLRSQMGHCSEAMTERYSGVSVEAKRKAVLQLHKMTGGGDAAVQSYRDSYQGSDGDEEEEITKEKSPGISGA